MALAGEFAALSWGPRVLLTSSSTDVAARAEIDDSGAVGFLPNNELPGAPLQQLLAGR